MNHVKNATERFALCLALIATLAWGKVCAQNPLPVSYRVLIRYSIRAPVSQRVAQFREMTNYLSAVGFVKDPGPATEPEDSDAVYMRGVAPHGSIEKILTAPHVHSVLLVPTGFALPTGDKLVKVQLSLRRIATLPTQRMLADQVRGLLAEQGFAESIGYDNHRQTRIVGAIPARNLLQLLEDLRWQDSGWLVPETPATQLPEPIREIWPVNIVEVLPETSVPPPAVLPGGAQAAVQDPSNKISRELRTRLGQSQPIRLELVVAGVLAGEPPAWTANLESLLAATHLEGRTGDVLTVRAPPNLAPSLARLSDVVSVRLPRPADPEGIPAIQAPAASDGLLQKTGLAKFHQHGARGQKIRVAVIGTDFRGYAQFVGRQLPANLQLLDLTAECNAMLQPIANPAAGTAIGYGTLCALAASQAAPGAQIVLIRVEPDAPFQLLQIANCIEGKVEPAGCLLERSQELLADSRRLEQVQDQLLVERKDILDSFGQDPESVRRREAHFQKQAELTEQQKQLQGRQDRYFKLLADLQALKGTHIAVSTLVWSDGYPVNGVSGLSRYFDDDPPCRTIWFQAGGNTRGQTWNGYFHDVDGNGVMEFAGPNRGPLPDRWTTELNFLGWLRPDGQRSPDLPPGTFRVSVQWAEPHEAALGYEAYQQSLANLRLVILRQRDPTGGSVPTDDMELVAVSTDYPGRLRQLPTLGVYSQSVEFTVSQPGRYAVRLEGGIPPTLRPGTISALPGQATHWELWPRLFVEAGQQKTGSAARPIFLDYATDLGNPGMPADSHHIVSVGAATLAGGRQPYSSGGPPTGQRLYVKPDLISYDELHFGIAEIARTQGSGMAASFAAGVAGTLLSAGTTLDSLRDQLYSKPGKTWPP
jgi:hypothetical protein